MTAATPEQVLNAIDGLERRIRGLGQLYRELHPSAFQQRIGDHRSPSAPDDDDELAGRDSISDVGDTLLATGAVRRHITRAGRLVVQAEVCLATAWSELGKAQSAIEGSMPQSSGPSSERQLPRTVDKADRKADSARLKAAAKYKAERTETYARAGLRLNDTGAGEGR